MARERQLRGDPTIIGHHILPDALLGTTWAPQHILKPFLSRIRSGADLAVLLADDPSPDNLHHVAEKPQHTNQILDYFGFPESARAQLLRVYNGDYQYGAEIIRATYTLVEHFGLIGNHEGTSSQTRNIFLSVADLVHHNDVKTASLLIEKLGFEHTLEIAGMLKGYTTLQVGGETSLVLKSHLRKILSKRDQFMLGSSRGPEAIHQLGFEPQNLHGVVIYRYHRTKETCYSI